MNFKTKFSIDDQVFYMSGNKIVQSMVKGVSVFQGQRTLSRGWDSGVNGTKPTPDTEETMFEGANIIYYTKLDPMGIPADKVFKSKKKVVESILRMTGIE